MTKIPKLTSYCLDWHIKNSDAFKDMLVELLKPYAEIKLTAWDGEKIPDKPSDSLPLIFSMLPPPESLLKNKKLRLVWLPMWDQAQGYSQEWWNNLPKTLRVVAFSDVIYKKAKAAGLPTLRFTYYKDPSHFKKVSWDNGLILFYWNRVGMVGPQFIENLCLTVKPSKLIFLSNNDPRIEENKFYKLPKIIGHTQIKEIKPTDRDTFLKNTEEANVMIAPRLTEGVGMTFLEMMCRGGVVLANDAPTMNEYIENGKNGFLFGNNYHSRKEQLVYRSKRKSLEQNNPAPFLLSEKQPWKKIAKANFRKIGNQAYDDHVAGFEIMQKDIKKYADFVLNW